MLRVHNFVSKSTSTSTDGLIGNTNFESLKENDLIRILQSIERGKVLVCGSRSFNSMITSAVCDHLRWPMKDIYFIGEKYNVYNKED